MFCLVWPIALGAMAISQAKQYETNKDKINNISKSSKVKKKPIYDARKAIEEAKLKQEKNKDNRKI